MGAKEGDPEGEEVQRRLVRGAVVLVVLCGGLEGWVSGVGVGVGGVVGVVGGVVVVVGVVTVIVVGGAGEGEVEGVEHRAVVEEGEVDTGGEVERRRRGTTASAGSEPRAGSERCLRQLVRVQRAQLVERGTWATCPAWW